MKEEDLKQYDEIADELQSRIANMKEGHCEYDLGKYTRIMYQANDVCLGFQKIITTSDKQDWGELYYISVKAFFNCFPHARAEFNEIKAKAVPQCKRKSINNFTKRINSLQKSGKVPKLTINTENTIIE